MISRRAGLKALGAAIGAAALGTTLVTAASAAPGTRKLAMNTNDRLAYIRRLDIGAHPTALRAGLGDGDPVPEKGPAAAIDKGSLVSFTRDVSGQHRSDALNSCLLAQLNSDKLFNRFDPGQLMDWYRNYTNVLSNIGWVIQDFEFEHYQASGSTMSVSSAVFEILSAVLSGNDLKLVSAALNSLAKLEKSNSPWYQVWDSSSHDQANSNFQLSHCNDNGDKANTLEMTLSGYSLRTKSSATRFLWVDYESSSTDLMFSSQACTLDEDIYSQVRKEIIKKLGKNATTFVANLEV
ncbi:hypothetical protein [Lentzea sp. NPDC004782]|uniref:hypothetical protein n=1 Tax=Lentzea sp. NPDC004782 TaxID=3154458 RepID=UPI00339DDF4A